MSQITHYLSCSHSIKSENPPYVYSNKFNANGNSTISKRYTSILCYSKVFSVLEAHQTLHALIPYNNKRKYFGISWPDKSGNIIYKAAAEELVTGELANHNLETKTIPGGNYLFIDVPDLMKNIPEIGKAFDKLIHDERIDPNGFCIEWYLTQDLCRCMVKTK